eukprot:12251561-Heterocapsa_arctica.AAC.1
MLSLLKNRKDYKGVDVGIDQWAKANVLSSLKLTAIGEGALRPVTAGNIVCQDKVDNWEQDNGICRFCKAA